MVSQNCPGIAQFNCMYTSYSDYQENVWHVHHKDGSSWTNAQLSSMSGVIANWDQTSLANRRNTAFALFKIHARDLSTATGAEFDGGYASNGNKTGTAFPENVTFSIMKQSGLSGRSNRGRVFHIGLTESDVTNDRVSNTEQAALQTAYVALLTAVNAVANCELCILSRYTGKALRANGIAVPIVGFAQADSFVDSQRRRLPAHNRHR